MTQTDCSREPARTRMKTKRRPGRLVPFDAHGDAHAAANAERGESLFGVALLHLVQQRGENARARGSDGMAYGDRAAIDIDLARIEAEVLVHRQGLCGEGLVSLDEVEIIELPAGLFQRLA